MLVIYVNYFSPSLLKDEFYTLEKRTDKYGV